MTQDVLGVSLGGESSNMTGGSKLLCSMVLGVGLSAIVSAQVRARESGAVFWLRPVIRGPNNRYVEMQDKVQNGR